MKIKKITITEVQFLAFRLAQELMEWGEPIPEFESRYPNRLESCLDTPFQSFEKPFYPGLIKKAATLFYLMNKNHPFENGNKRVAIVTLIYFLSENRRWLEVSNKKLYGFAKYVAASNPTTKRRKGVLNEIERFLTSNMVKLGNHPLEGLTRFIKKLIP